jgi:hypothetical protein
MVRSLEEFSYSKAPTEKSTNEFLKSSLDLEIPDNRNDPLHVNLSFSDFEDFDSGVGQLKLFDL